MSIMNRYGISALSKQFKDKAQIQEIMIDKMTGEIQIKSYDGSIVSYNALDRLNSHVHELTFNCMNTDNYGNMYEIEIPELDKPAVVEEPRNLLLTPILLDCKKRLNVSIDIDKVVPNKIISTISINEPFISMVLSYTELDEVKTITIEKPVSSFNMNSIALKDISSNPIDNISITNLRIVDNEKENGEYYIVYSVLLVKE